MEISTVKCEFQNTHVSPSVLNTIKSAIRFHWIAWSVSIITKLPSGLATSHASNSDSKFDTVSCTGPGPAVWLTVPVNFAKDYRVLTAHLHLLPRLKYVHTNLHRTA